MIRLTKQKSKHSEELIKEIINAYLDNEGSVPELGRRYDISPRLIRHWVEGTNRGHLLDAVFDQRQKEGKL